MEKYTSTDNSGKRLLVVTSPVADLMGKPVEGPYRRGPGDLQETQLLLNESLIYHGEDKEWFYVEAPEQLKLVRDDNWGGYKGWVRKGSVMFTECLPALNVIVGRGTAAFADPFETAAGDIYLSVGTKLFLTGEHSNDLVRTNLPGGTKKWVRKSAVLETMSQKTPGEQRRQIIETAMSFIGTPYLWGGRSTHLPSLISRKGHRETGGIAIATGVDCSGLTNLAMRVAGIGIPRNAHDQWIASRRIDPGELKSADLIFLSSDEQPDRIKHVMIFLDNEEFIEAAETGSTVAINTFRNKFGQTKDKIVMNGSTAGNLKVHWRSFV